MLLLAPLRIVRLALTYLVIALLVFAALNFPTLETYLSSLFAHPKPVAAASLPRPGATAPTSQFRIVIPELGVDAPVILSQATHWADMHPQLEEGVVHYANTALPGEVGNVALTGHSSNYAWDHGRYNQVFTLLGDLKSGDPVILYYGGQVYRYQVDAKKVVSPYAAEVLKPTPQPTLTLITCWPILTDWQRLVVVAHQV